MRVVRDLTQVSEAVRGAAVAIGNFDGVHRGHRVLLDRVRQIARAEHIPAGVIIFEPHPREFFQPDQPHFRLTPLAEKFRLFDEAGLNVAVVLDFDAHLAELSAEAFIQKVLVDALGVRHVVVGHDFLFGRDRTGSPETLKDSGRADDFEVHVIAPQGVSGTVYSSSVVRQHLMGGDVRAAAGVLGHWWRVRGTVVLGEKLGRELGFPTANIKLPLHVALAHGIYAVYVWLEEKRFEAAAYYGNRPTVNGTTTLLEVFIFDFSGDLYGAEISVDFVDFVRGDQNFATHDALIDQIERDCEVARRQLGGVLVPWL